MRFIGWFVAIALIVVGCVVIADWSDAVIKECESRHCERGVPRRLRDGCFCVEIPTKGEP